MKQIKLPILLHTVAPLSGLLSNMSTMLLSDVIVLIKIASFENLKNSGDFVLTWKLDEFVFASLAFEKSWNSIEYRI